MKRLILLCFLFSGITIYAQDDSIYANLLKSTEEVSLTDSINLNTMPDQMNRLDSMTVKKWFAPLLPATANNRLKNRNYYLTGKITSNSNFDLLLLVEEKKRSDSSDVQVVYLVSTRKDGKYIASLEVAVTGIRKKSSYNTSSWLYKDNKIVLDAKYTVNEKPYADITYYKINVSGRFILSPNY